MGLRDTCKSVTVAGVKVFVSGAETVFFEQRKTGMGVPKTKVLGNVERLGPTDKEEVAAEAERLVAYVSLRDTLLFAKQSHFGGRFETRTNTKDCGIGFSGGGQL